MKQLFGLLLLVGIIAAYFWWIVAIVAVVGGGWLLVRYLEQRADEAAREATEKTAREKRLIEQADQQHNWAQQGDPRGTFGEGYVPLPV